MRSWTSTRPPSSDQEHGDSELRCKEQEQRLQEVLSLVDSVSRPTLMIVCSQFKW